MKLPSFAEFRSLSTSDRNALFPSSESAVTFPFAMMQAEKHGFYAAAVRKD
jgi:hypothetical protein